MATPSYITHTFAASVVVSSKLGMMSQMSLVTTCVTFYSLSIVASYGVVVVVFSLSTRVHVCCSSDRPTHILAYWKVIIHLISWASRVKLSHLSEYPVSAGTCQKVAIKCLSSSLASGDNFFWQIAVTQSPSIHRLSTDDSRRNR